MSSSADPLDPLLFVDSCAVNGFALANVDPTKALAGSAYRVVATPGLRAEYRRALDHRLVEPHIKALLQRLIDHAALHEAAERPQDGTDETLVALSRRAFVVTRDRKPPWDRAVGNPGLLLWNDVEVELKRGATLVEILDARFVPA